MKSTDIFWTFICFGILVWLILLTFLKQGSGKYNQNFLPDQDNVYNLGDATNRWKSLFVGEGTIFITDAVRGNKVALTVSDGVFFIDGIAQAQLENVKLTNLTFNDRTIQTTAYIPSVQTSFNPEFKSANDLFNGGSNFCTGFYTMISLKICSYRINVDFSQMSNNGNASQYQVKLPFPAKNTFRHSGGVLHQTLGNSLYHIVGIVDISISREIMFLYYFASQTDLPWKSSTPVGGTTQTSHFDISGIYDTE